MIELRTTASTVPVRTPLNRPQGAKPGKDVADVAPLEPCCRQSKCMPEKVGLHLERQLRAEIEPNIAAEETDGGRNQHQDGEAETERCEQVQVAFADRVVDNGLVYDRRNDAEGLQRESQHQQLGDRRDEATNLPKKIRQPEGFSLLLGLEVRRGRELESDAGKAPRDFVSCQYASAARRIMDPKLVSSNLGQHHEMLEVPV